MNKQYNNKEIENILRRYPKLKAKAEIKGIGKDLFPSCTANYDPVCVQTNTTSDTTANFAIKRIDGQETSHKVVAIEIFLQGLSERQRMFVKLYYFDKLYEDEVQGHLHIGRGTFWRIRESVINDFAEMLL